MRILIENGSHSLKNLGDIAMLRASVERISEYWPDAECHVITHYPDRLADHLPSARPAVVRLPTWQRFLLGLAGQATSSASPRVRSAVEAASRVLPARARMANLTRQVADHDLVVLCGCGLLADPFRFAAVNRLQLLYAAQRAGVPTALLSQGIGPIEQRQLSYWAPRVLPNALMISLREGIHGPALLRSMSIAPDQFVVTGDDSLSLTALGSRSDRTADALGINLRLTAYSGVDVGRTPMLDQLQQRFHRFLARQSAPMTSLSIEQTDHDRMRRALPALFDDQATANHPHRLETLIEEIRRCRLVIAGSYHAAVFALGLGIPAVCLANSRYYRWKFDGLQSFFGEGCLLIDMREPGWDEALEQALVSAWQSATLLRRDLVRATNTQVESVRSAYSRLVERVGKYSR